MNFTEQLDKIIAWREDAPAEQKAKLDKLIKLGKSVEKLPAEAAKKVRANVEAIAKKLKEKEDKVLESAKALEKKAVQAVKKAEEKTTEAAKKVVSAETKKAASKTPTKGKRGPKHAGETFFGRAKMIQLQKGLSWAEAKAEAKKFFAEQKKAKAESVKKQINNFAKSVKPSNFARATKDTSDVTRDASRPAKPFGKRKSRAGAKRPYYWENRSNRADVKQPPKSFPKLEQGGSVEDFGKGGRPKSAHNRDHKYISGEEHEKKYAPKRKSESRYAKRKFENGGKVSRFDKLANKVASEYEGKRVKSEYQGEYGKTYSESEAKQVGRKVAAKVARLQKVKESRFSLAKKANGGSIELFKQGGNVKVSIVNEGEIWNDKRFEGVLGDYDRDGIPNADDIAPRNARVKGRVDPQSLAETVSSVVELKNSLDGKMYEFVDKLKEIAPSDGKVLARTKTPYSILKKLVEKRLTDKKKGLTDLVGTTIVTSDKAQLDVVNNKVGRGYLGEVMDYEDMYSQPKGGYRAYHYIVEFNGTPIELQLKTARQKALNELSHAPYKAKKLNAPLLKKWTDIANKADEGDKKAAEQMKQFLSQPNLEKVFYV